MSELQSKHALRVALALLCIAWSGCPDVGVVGEHASERAGAGASDAGGAADSGDDDDETAGRQAEPDEPDDEDEDELCIIGLAPCAPCGAGSTCPDGLTCLESLCRQCLEDEDCDGDGHCELGACEIEEEEESDGE